MILYGTLLLIALVRLAYALTLPIVPDEAYYWAWSRQLDLSYYDQGPGIAYLIRLFTALFGHTSLALKGAATFCAIASAAFLLESGRLLGASLKQRFAILLLITFLPGFFGGALVIMHDSLLILCWSAATFFTLRYIERNSALDMIGIFIAVGLGLLTKHTMAFFALSFIVFLLLRQGAFTSFLRQPIAYAGFGLCLLIASPLLIWNARNDWVGIEAIQHLRSSGGRFAEGSVPEFIAGQLIMFSPGFALMLVLFPLLAAFQNWRTAGIKGLQQAWKVYRQQNAASVAPATSVPAGIATNPGAVLFLILVTALPLAFFLLMSVTRTVQPNWTFPTYLSAILLLIRIAPQEPVARVLARTLSGLSIAFCLAFAFVMIGAESIERWLDRRFNTYYIPALRYSGYREAVLEIEAERLRRDPEAVLVANRYQDAAIASWYLPDQRYVPSLNIMQKNQYSFWEGLAPGQNAIVFSIQENTCEKATIFFSPLLRDIFKDADIREYKETDVLVKDRVAKRYQLYYATDYERSWDHLLYNYIVRRAIQDFMPSLKDEQSTSGSTTSGEAQKRIADAITELFLSRKGKVKCDLFE